jgi:DNA-binding IclR family transcriptional regulator
MQTSVGKALSLLTEVGALSSSREAVLSELARRTGISKATTHRLLAELKVHGFVEQNAESSTYKLSRMVLVLGAQYQQGIDLRRQALPVLEALANQTKLTSHLAIQDGNEVIYIEKVETFHNVRIASGIGWRRKLHCTSLGKAILAFSGDELINSILDGDLDEFTKNTITEREKLVAELKSVRRHGFAIDDTENQDEIRCVAAPVFDRNSRVVAAISVSATTSQLSNESLARVGETVKGYALKLSEELGHVSVL